MRGDQPAPSTLVLEHALQLALIESDEDEAVVELVGLAGRDRRAIESVRQRLLVVMAESDDAGVGHAVHLLDAALVKGARRGLW